jgi:Family of unknown function (DUF5681)
MTFSAFKQRRRGAVRGFSMKADVKQGKRCRSKTDNTNGQQKPWLFKPGQSGNPAGRPRGARNKLADDFLADAYAQWQQHGSTALETMANTEPAKFCQMVANLLPKEAVLQDERVQISEIKLVIIDAAQPQARITEHDDTKREPLLIEAKPAD